MSVERAKLFTTLASQSFFNENEIKAIYEEVMMTEKEKAIKEAHIYTKKGFTAINTQGIYHNYLDSTVMEVERLLKIEHIEETTEIVSEWQMPVVMVERHLRSPMLTLDFKMLNKAVRQSLYPIPNPAEFFSTHTSIKYFSIFSIKGGFSNIPLHESSRVKSTFKVQSRKFVFKVLPIGYINSHVIFQERMDNILEGYAMNTCLSYYENIVVFSNTIEDHKKDVSNVLCRIKQYGLDIIWEDALLARKEINLNRIHISEYDGFITPDKASVQKILSYKIPSNPLDLKRFISCVHVNRRFIRNVAEILKPLYILSHVKECKYQWCNSHKNAFNNIRKNVTKLNNIYFPNFNDPFTVLVTVNMHSISAKLTQNYKIIEYASQTLKMPHRSYDYNEKSLHAVVFALNRWQHYLESNSFCLISNYQYMERYRNSAKRGHANVFGITRWFYSILDKYTFTHSLC
ncbi:hypothetical protein NEPAR08_1427 [Nematocida parisii]|nr:hypothetical protein NEPAR08_1427 [Nematocida parisii]KAI5129178.1 hypothetical protein NEPAR03_1578 [Nematocida parisii]